MLRVDSANNIVAAYNNTFGAVKYIPYSVAVGAVTPNTSPIRPTRAC